jgi:predicted aspartyl protease
MQGKVIEMEALIDTGYEGDIMIPPELVPIGTPTVGGIRGVLADGSEARAPLHRGAVTLEGLGTLSVLVAALGDEPLVGLGILSNFSVWFDHGRRVIIEP